MVRALLLGRLRTPGRTKLATKGTKSTKKLLNFFVLLCLLWLLLYRGQ